jgi:four helix bundle protein
VENKKISRFTDLFAWQESHKLVLRIYAATRSFPKEELFGLTNQMRRAAVSITSNIAEGFGRHSYKEKVQFYHLAKGSINEVKNQLLIARDVNYLNKPVFEAILKQADISDRILQGLIAKTKSFVKLKNP